MSVSAQTRMCLHLCSLIYIRCFALAPVWHLSDHPSSFSSHIHTIRVRNFSSSSTLQTWYGGSRGCFIFIYCVRAGCVCILRVCVRTCRLEVLIIEIVCHGKHTGLHGYKLSLIVPTTGFTGWEKGKLWQLYPVGLDRRIVVTAASIHTSHIQTHPYCQLTYHRCRCLHPFPRMQIERSTQTGHHWVLHG